MASSRDDPVKQMELVKRAAGESENKDTKINLEKNKNHVRV